MLNRSILAFVSFIAGGCVAIMIYDSRLAGVGFRMATHATESGISLDIAWGFKLAWTVMLVAVMIVCVLIPPKKEGG